jgi:hypothetical protein
MKDKIQFVLCGLVGALAALLTAHFGWIVAVVFACVLTIGLILVDYAPKGRG